LKVGAKVSRPNVTLLGVVVVRGGARVVVTVVDVFFASFSSSVSFRYIDGMNNSSSPMGSIKLSS
jgi:hypothetical protein